MSIGELIKILVVYKNRSFYNVNHFILNIFPGFEGLVTRALLLANFEAAVEVCLHHNKMAEAITLAIAGGPELLLRTQKRFFQSSKTDLNRVGIHFILRNDTC